MEAKAERIVKELLGEIAAGRYGSFGAAFLTTRDLASYKQVSLKTAFSILGKLREAGVIEKSGKRYLIHNAVPVSTENPGKRLLIGLLVTSLDSPYFARLAADVEEFAHSVGASLLIASGNRDFSKERERLEMFCQQGASGLLICPWANENEESFFRTLPVPYVLIGSPLKNVKADTVLVNNQMAAQKMASYLVEAGYREFAYIGISGLSSRDRRLQGFRFGLMEHDCVLPEKNILLIDSSDSEMMKSRISVFLKQLKKPTALFCYHDLFASTAVNLCHRLGISVPDEIGIAGFDDLPIASELYPSLTTVRYPIRDMARIACETLFARINLGNRKEDGFCRYLDSELVIRDSTNLQITASQRRKIV